jgi:hypothetical protein
MYSSNKKKKIVEKDSCDVKIDHAASGEPGTIPDHLIHAGIQHLNLTSSAGKVVIPRGMLVRLIEQTINLSGAAVHGDDVVIERYSPTWHRFARLLRTSDLHKISMSIDLTNVLPPHSQEKNHRAPPETQELTSKKSKETPIATEPPVECLNANSQPSPSAVVEREYVILALDARKKKVVTTRFRRLLDGSSNVPISSSESLLKVEHLNKYVTLL